MGRRSTWRCCRSIRSGTAGSRSRRPDRQDPERSSPKLCASKAGSLRCFSLTLQAPDLAVQELEDGGEKRGLKGAAIGGMVAGVGSPIRSSIRFGPRRRNSACRCSSTRRAWRTLKRLSGNGWLGNTIGNPLETTIALSHLIFEGTLDRFPGLKVIAAHGGGFLPSYADRSDHACVVGPAGCNADIKAEEEADRVSQANSISIR